MSEGEMDQELAKMRDFIPGVWYGIYQGCLDKGFDKYQSFALLQTWILAQNHTVSNHPRTKAHLATRSKNERTCILRHHDRQS